MLKPSAKRRVQLDAGELSVARVAAGGTAESLRQGEGRGDPLSSTRQPGDTPRGGDT